MSDIYEIIKNRFATYLDRFSSDDTFIQQNVSLKKDHTDRVVIESRGLADHLGLPERDKRLILISALLHDVARFPQISLYRSFKDRETRDHGDWGAQIIRSEDFLKELPEEERTIILTVVRLHNKFILPGDLDETTLLYCHVIRDADKIDIFRVVTSMNVTEEGIVEEQRPKETGDYNPLLVKSLLNKTNADYHQVFSTLDMYLLQLSWIFSLNFPHSLGLISRRGDVERLLEKLPTDDTLEEVKRFLRKYIEEYLQEPPNEKKESYRHDGSSPVVCAGSLHRRS
ncbi:MAG: HD domain-containing protein [Spirochaetales bacterium]|nr:HD domain-containing protein [Spirochaetales bacterium]